MEWLVCEIASLKLAVSTETHTSYFILTVLVGNKCVRVRVSAWLLVCIMLAGGSTLTECLCRAESSSLILLPESFERDFRTTSVTVSYKYLAGQVEFGYLRTCA